MPLTFPNKVVLKDVLQGLRELPDGCADILIADPPYNVGKDFGNNQDRLPLPEYVQWSRQWMDEGMRVLSPTGTFYIYGMSETLANLLVVSTAAFKRWLIWHYSNKNVASAPFWQHSHESILVLGHRSPRFNRDEVREPYTQNFLRHAAGKVRAGTASRFGSGKPTTYAAHERGALPRDVIRAPALAGGAGARERAHYCKGCECMVTGREKKNHVSHGLVTHPTQKPLALSEKLVKAARNPAGTTCAAVLFSGSGAELVAARRLGCDVLGFDINPDYVSMGNAWLHEDCLVQSDESNE